jgi:poly-gamma-glutamate capsule biosynthesis protein CapA/YwtB (metallophosphatase superfamily)
MKRIDKKEFPDRTLFLCGDVMTGRGVDQVLSHPGDVTLHEPSVRDARRYVELAEEAHGPVTRPLEPAAIWGDALAVLDAVKPAARIINLETAVTQADDWWPDKEIHYRMHPANVSCLTAARIDVVSIHWGTNWGYDVSEQFVSFAHALIDGGVDVVHGHSAHHVRPIEVYRDRVILYGCGDFIDDYEGIRGQEVFRPDLAVMYLPTLDPAGRLVGLQMVPFQMRRFRLTRVRGADVDWLAGTLTAISERFGCSAVVEGEGEIALRW